MNNLVSPPSRNDWQLRPRIQSQVTALARPLEEDKNRPWWMGFIFSGLTANLDWLACHVSVLQPGIQPHPSHSHEDEEVLMMLSGEAEISVRCSGGQESESHCLTLGSFVYYPSQMSHTLRNVGATPLQYFMFKWRSCEARSRRPLGFVEVDFSEALSEGDVVSRRGFKKLLLEGATQHLRCLHTHLTYMAPGEGYDPHVDAYDVAILVILVLSGEVETLD